MSMLLNSSVLAATTPGLLQAITINNDTFPEDIASDTLIGTLSGMFTDNDDYYHSLGELAQTVPGLFYFEDEGDGTGLLYVSHYADFETAPSPTFTFHEELYARSDDSLVETRDTILQLHVTNVGGDPTLGDLTLSVYSVNEGVPSGTAVASIIGLAPGSYPNVIVGNSHFVVSGGNIVTTGSLDYEAGLHSVDITIREILGWATNGPYHDTNLTIAINDVTPSVVSTTAYESGAVAVSSWTPFTALDLSDCAFAIFVMSTDGASVGATTSSGWVRFPRAGTRGPAAVFYKVNPTNNETLAITGLVSADASGVLFRCNGVTTYGDDSASSNAASTNPNPTQILDGTVREYLVLTTCHTLGGVPSAGPSGYSGFVASSVTTPLRSAGAYKVPSQGGLSEDPGAFTATIGAWRCFTIYLY